MADAADLYQAAVNAVQGTTVPASVLYGIAVQEGALVPGTLAHDEHNVGGIKSAGLPGPSITLPTREFLNGAWTTVQAQFRVFNSAADGFRGLVSFLQQNSRYRPALATPAGNPLQFLQAVAAAGYATDPNWVSAVWEHAQTAVRQFGSGTPGPDGNPGPDPPDPGNPSPPDGSGVLGGVQGIAGNLQRAAANGLAGFWNSHYSALILLSAGGVLVLIGLLGLALKGAPAIGAVAGGAAGGPAGAAAGAAIGGGVKSAAGGDVVGGATRAARGVVRLSKPIRISARGARKPKGDGSGEPAV